ncbi:MAG: hypothetical protein H0W73_00920 [Bacteroidetes bacterium]|nr:hypothetical protein [Bacteroidota bacterium]
MNSEFKHKRRFFFFPLIAAAFILGAGYAVMFLWNTILPSVIPAVGTLTYIQAIGLLILCRILFGGFKARGGYGGNGYRGGPPWRQKMMNMSEEEREKFKNEWKERCGRK